MTESSTQISSGNKIAAILWINLRKFGIFSALFPRFFVTFLQGSSYFGPSAKLLRSRPRQMPSEPMLRHGRPRRSHEKSDEGKQSSILKNGNFGLNSRR
jgi:hypothetical protein